MISLSYLQLSCQISDVFCTISDFIPSLYSSSFFSPLPPLILQPHIRINISEKCIQDIDLYIARTHLFHTSTEVYSRISVSCWIRTIRNISPDLYEGTIDTLLCSYIHWFHMTILYSSNERANTVFIFCIYSNDILCSE